MNLQSVNKAGETVRYQRGTLSRQQVNGIRRESEFQFSIPASDGRSRYFVNLDHEHGTAINCSCPIGTNRPDQACKHMLAIDSLKIEF